MFWRLKCHACGTRSGHLQGSSITQFQCSSCQTWNFVDKNGGYIDPPAAFVQQQAVHQRSRQLTPTVTAPSQQNIFCQTCLRNQQMHHDLLSNYLPDEDDPQYDKFEKGLPQYKRQLDERYPQICKDCAPKAQSMIHEADYYSMTNNASRLMVQSRGARRSLSPQAVMSRDSWSKTFIRTVLGVVEWLVLLSAAHQILWHAFAIVEIEQESLLGGRLSPMRQDGEPVEAISPVKASQCLEEISRLHFSNGCLDLVGAPLPKLLLLSLCFVWYNHGLKQLYSPNIRVASVFGWKEHLAISLFTVLMRLMSFGMRKALQETTLLNLDPRHEQAVHTISIVLIIAGHHLASRSIKTEKWRVNGSIMPRPEDKDILGQFAGPAAEKQIPRASLLQPSVLLSRENAAPFPIQNLARGRTAATRAPLLPSPPRSDIGDPMDIEPVPPAQSLGLFNNANSGLPSDWDPVRTNLFSIEDEMRARQQQGRQNFDDDKYMYFRPQQPTPFRGRLPQAPMSQERKLRNPTSQVPQFKEIPVTQRRDFLQQMRNGIDRGKGFQTRERSVDSDRSEVTTDAASRTRGQLHLAESDWHLPSDIAATTGLEDQFGGTFKINDRAEPAEAQPVGAQQMSLTPQQWYAAGISAFVAVLIMFIFDVAGLRRGICLYFVRRLEEMGY